MDNMIFSWLVIIFGAALAVLGVPLAFAIGVAGAIGIYFIVGETFLLNTISLVTYSMSSDYAFAVIPLFVLMGGIANYTDLITDLYEALNRLLARVRGGLLMATTLASAGFAAVSGSTIVNAALFTRIALPEVERRGYSPGISAGLIAGAGTFAAMIPPSLSFIVYGILTDQSIGKLFVAGIIPGVVSAVAYLLLIYFIGYLRPDLIPRGDKVKTPYRKKLSMFGSIWPITALSFIVLGSIYAGFAAPTAAGALGVAGVVLIAIARRKMKLNCFWKALLDTCELTSVLFVLIIAGLFFSRFLTISGFIEGVTHYLAGGGLNTTEFMLMVVVLYFILGMFIDPTSMLVMTIPIVFPAAQALDLDPIWLGVIVCKMIEIAVITPPVGLNLFTVVSASKGSVSIKQIYMGILPFVFIEICILALLIVFPSISTYLPSTM